MHLRPFPATHAARSIVVAALLATLVAACGAAAPTPSPVPTPAPTFASTPDPAATPGPTPTPAFPMTVTDDEGTAVTIPARPERIVSLTPATTEILFAVGAGDRLAGTTDADDYPEAAKAITRVVTMGTIDVEKIVGLEADLVVAGGNGFNYPAVLARLRDLGMPVVVVYAPDVATALRDVELVATAAGEEAAGAELAARMETEIRAIGESIAAAGGAPPRVFYELDVYQGTIYGPADDTLYEEMIRLAGGDPITTGSSTVFAIPLETLLAADPQVIVLGDAAYGVTPEIVASRPGWGGMTAVAAGAIRPVNDVVVTRPGPRLVEGLRALALAIDPGVALPPAPTTAP